MKDKLREAVADLEAGGTTDAGYTVQNAVADFLQKELKGRAKGTIDNYSCRRAGRHMPQVIMAADAQGQDRPPPDW